MKIEGIYTERKYQTKPFWDLVHEWEEDICKNMNTPLIYSSKYEGVVNKIIRKCGSLSILSRIFDLWKSKPMLFFEMSATFNTPSCNHKNIIPVIIDFFIKAKDIPAFLQKYDRCPIIIMSSREAYDKVISFKHKKPIIHLPLTLSERYRNNGCIYSKKYCMTLFGRQNSDPFFGEMVRRYASENPSFEYVYQDEKENIYKTNKGKIIGAIQSRDEYISLVRATKITIYSTPGLGGRKDCNGYNQVTPKFLEFVSAQCHVILRYPDNSDTRFFELSKFSKSIDNYKNFQKAMDKYIKTSPDYEFYNSYMNKHYTDSLTDTLQNLEIIS